MHKSSAAFRVRLATLVAALVLGTALAACPAIAQPQESAPEELGLKSVWCPDCEVRIREVVALGDAEGPGILEDYVVEARLDSRGRYYVLESTSPRVQVYGPEGRHLATIGREGQGPGEFRNVSDIVVGEADSLYAFDLLNGTLSVFDPKHAFVRSARMRIPPNIHLESVGRGRFVIASWGRTPERIGFPLHRFGPEGRVEASFGSETEMFRPDQASRVMVAAADSGRVWVGEAHRYSLQLWDAFKGRKLRELRREVDWFPAGSPLLHLTVDEPPPARLQSFAYDGQGRVWTRVSVADPQWREAVEQAEDGRHVDITDPVRYEDSVIEILDSATGEPLSRFRLDRGLFFLDVREGLIAENVLDGGLVPRYKIYRLELVFSQEEETSNGGDR